MNNYQLNQYAVVNGLEGAKSYNMMPNQSILLMDGSNPYVYMKTTNQMGQASIRCFKLVEEQLEQIEVANSPYATKNDFKELNDKIDQLMSKLGGKKDA
jgi:hypothetical protein